MAVGRTRSPWLFLVSASGIVFLSSCDWIAEFGKTTSKSPPQASVRLESVPRALREDGRVGCLRAQGMSLPGKKELTGQALRDALNEFIALLIQPGNSLYEWPDGHEELAMGAEGQIDFYRDCDSDTPVLSCRIYVLAKVVDFGDNRLMKISAETVEEIERLFFTPP